MKKLLSIAIAAAVAAPMAVSADTTIYGLIDNALVSTDTDTGVAATSTDVWDIQQGNGSSRFGVKGSEDLGNGLKAIFQYEWGTNTTEGVNVASADEGNTGGTAALWQRLAYVGVQGGFGTVAIGRQWTPYYGAVDITNIMNVGGLNGVYSGITRTGDALAYISPNFNGFTAKAAVLIDGATGGNASDGMDAYNLSVHYANGPLTLGASVLNVDSALNVVGGIQDRWGVSGKYNFGNFAIMGQYEDVDNFSTVGNTAGFNSYALAAEAYFGNNTIRAVYGERDGNAALNAGDIEEWSIGVQHNFSKRTRVYAEYGQQEGTGTVSTTDIDTFGIGLRHDF